jgi:hypothetical protein
MISPSSALIFIGNKTRWVYRKGIMSGAPVFVIAPFNEALRNAMVKLGEMRPYLQVALDKLVAEGKETELEACRLKVLIRDELKNVCGGCWTDTSGNEWRDTIFSDRIESDCRKTYSQMTVYYNPHGIAREVSLVTKGSVTTTAQFDSDGKLTYFSNYSTNTNFPVRKT